MVEVNQGEKITLIGDDLKSLSSQFCPDVGMDEAESQKVSSSPVKATDVLSGVGGMEKKSIFKVKSANQTIDDALKEPDPIPLYGAFWFEGEMCCLFADSNVGKSIFAVQIGDSIADKRKEPVFYFDFELSEKMFQMRCTDKDTGEVHQFPDNFFRIEIDPDALLGDNFEDDIINGIEEIVISTSAKIVIIDNISFLETKSEKGDCATILMVRLKALRDKYNLSILILAHTPKRDLSRPINQNDLSGSKKLFNFFRSAFVISKSAKDESLRYIKQVKVTSIMTGLQYYTDGRVRVCEIKSIKGLVCFVHIEDAWEKDHLKSFDKIDDETLTRAKDMLSEGKSYGQIAKALNVSKSTIYVKLKK